MRKKIDEALGNFEEPTLRVKQAILEQTKHRMPIKSKSFYKPLIALIAVITLFIGGYALSQQVGQSSQPAPTTATENPVVDLPISHGTSIPHEKTIEILKYENFYYHEVYSNEIAEILAYEQAAALYSVLYHMEKYNYTFPRDRMEHYKNRAQALFNVKMEDEFFKKYFELIRDNHGITEQDYVEHYLYVQEMSTYMSNELHKKYVGYVNNKYPEQVVIEEYKVVAGLSTDQLIKNYMNKIKMLNEKVDESIVNPLDQYGVYARLAYNDSGEVVIVPEDLYDGTPLYLPNASTAKYGFQDFIYSKVLGNNFELAEKWIPFSYMNFKEHKEALQNFKGTAEQEAYAKLALEYQEILGRSIDLKATKPNYLKN